MGVEGNEEKTKARQSPVLARLLDPRKKPIENTQDEMNKDRKEGVDRYINRWLCQIEVSMLMSGDRV